jgi:hypothetical protein
MNRTQRLQPLKAGDQFVHKCEFYRHEPSPPGRLRASAATSTVFPAVFRRIILQRDWREETMINAANSIRRPVMRYLRAAVLATTAFGCGSEVADAGPCTKDIVQLQSQIARAEAKSPTVGPSAPQSVGAQLHHQPTPSSVGAAENKASADAKAALDRARQADAAGDAAACQRALTDARVLFGLE